MWESLNFVFPVHPMTTMQKIKSFYCNNCLSWQTWTFDRTGWRISGEAPSVSVFFGSWSREEPWNAEICFTLHLLGTWMTVTNAIRDIQSSITDSAQSSTFLSPLCICFLFSVCHPPSVSCSTSPLSPLVFTQWSCCRAQHNCFLEMIYAFWYYTLRANKTTTCYEEYF